MNTLFLSHVGTPGGAEYKMATLCEKTGSAVLLLEDGPLMDMLTKRGIKCRTLALSGDVQKVRRYDGFLAMIKTVPQVLGFLRKLAAELRDYDILVPMSQKAFVLVTLCRFFVRRPIIWFMNDLVNADHFSRNTANIMIALSNISGAHVVVNSRASLNAWIEAGADSGRCSIIYSGIDASKLNSINPERVSFLRKQFSADVGIVGVMVGRIASWKGQHVVLRALNDLPHLRVIFVGEAMFNEKAYEKELHDYVAENHLENQAWFLGHREDVLEVMSAVDIVIHSSTIAEPFGRVIVEGMMVGKPVIATNAGGPTEIIENERSGLLTEPGNPTDLCSAILKLSTDTTFSQSIAREGRRRAFELFNEKQLVDKFLIICERLAL